MNTLQRLTLHDAAQRLAFKDNRSAEKWCRFKGVYIHNDSGHKFVYETELSFAQEQDVIHGFKTKYPNNWREIYQSWKEGDSLSAYELANGEPITKTKRKVRVHEEDSPYINEITKIFNTD